MSSSRSNFLSSKWSLSRTTLPQVKTLFNFLLGVSIEWDLDDINLADSGAICRSYLERYYKGVEHGKEQSVANLTFLGCLQLWGEKHSLCPIIHDFNLQTLDNADDASVCLMLPQLVRALIATRDTFTLDYLIQRIGGEFCSTAHLFWLLMTELDIGTQEGIQTDKRFLKMAVNKVISPPLHRRSLKLQGVLIGKLVHLANYLATQHCSFSEKKSLFKKALVDSKYGLDLFEPVTWPLDPKLFVTAVVVEESNLFYSQLCPMLLTFLTTSGNVVKGIFKLGDDLRQDALLEQMTRCVRILSDDTLPIKKDSIICYRVLSTGSNHGLVEYIPSQCLEDVLHGQPTLDTWLVGDKLDTFIESCAFYSVWTFVMCVGDRHLDNILVTNSGHLFHIDYSFLGREPKPFAPSIKLCPEMMVVMGGPDGVIFRRFMSLCASVFKVLQSNSFLWLQPFVLLLDNGVMDIHDDTLEKIQQRLRVSEEYLLGEITKAFDSRLPRVMDNFHRTWKNINCGRVTDAVDEDWCDVEACDDIIN